MKKYGVFDLHKITLDIIRDKNTNSIILIQ